MHKDFKVPPRSKDSLTPIQEILTRLEPLIGADFNFIPDKARTNGTNLRKAIASFLHEHELSEPAEDGAFKIVPLKGKGIPKIKREFIDTYIVSSGDKYNLQVWNRIPNSDSILIEYENDDHLRSRDVRFILVKVDVDQNKIESIISMTSDYIEEKFGKFGKQTVKHQLIISERGREFVTSQKDSILFYPDESKIFQEEELSLQDETIHSPVDINKLLTLNSIRDKLAKGLIGKFIEPGPTKIRGQVLEAEIAKILGYPIPTDDKTHKLVGGYPDIRHQALEVKLQDSPTVDLGKYTPEFEVEVPDCAGITTRNIRYLIALTNPNTNIIEGVVLCPGKYLEKHFTHIANKSYKCQRSIPMEFFNSFKGQVVHNPTY